MESSTHNSTLARVPEHLQTVLATLSGHCDRAICLLDADHRLVWTNTAWGRARRQIESAGVTDWVDVVLHPGKHAVRFGRDEVPGELEIVRVDPHYLLLLFVPEVVAGQRQDLARLDQDSTERLIHSQKLESLGQLAAAVSLDFNQLLVAILGNADLLADDPTLAGHQRDALQSIIAAAELAAELCQQVRDYSGGDDFPRFGSVDLTELVQHMKHMIQMLTRAHDDVVLDLRLHTSPVTILGDSARLQQVLLNVLLNAVQAISDGGRIAIQTGVQYLDQAACERSLFADVSEGEYGYVRVMDNGVGMEPVSVQQLFQPGYSTKDTRRGYGLAAVAGIVEWHRGTVMVESTPAQESGQVSEYSQGFDICVFLPLKPEMKPQV